MPRTPGSDLSWAALAAADERSAFLTKTYLHLAGAIGLFVALEAVLLEEGDALGIVLAGSAGQLAAEALGVPRAEIRETRFRPGNGF